jgi:hypothetical protein
MSEGHKKETKRSPKSLNVVAGRIRLARENFPGRLTQDQLSGRLAALKVVIDRPAITKIELGTRRVYDFEVVALATALKVDVRWLLGLQQSGGPSSLEGGKREI